MCWVFGFMDLWIGWVCELGCLDLWIYGLDGYVSWVVWIYGYMDWMGIVELFIISI